MSWVTCHMSSVTCHVSHVRCHMSCVTCHVSHVRCHMSPLAPKPYELGSCNFERRFTSSHLWPFICNVSCVMCHMPHVMCHVSHVTCNFFSSFLTKLWSYSVRDLLSTGPTLSNSIYYLEENVKKQRETYINFGINWNTLWHKIGYQKVLVFGKGKQQYPTLN